MTTKTIGKPIVIRDPIVVQRFKSQLGHPCKMTVVERDVARESKRGVLRLKAAIIAGLRPEFNSAPVGD